MNNAVSLIFGSLIVGLLTLASTVVYLLTWTRDNCQQPYSARRAMQHQELNHEH